MARVRSPAYPSLSLSSAVEMIGKVHSAQQRTPEPRDVVMRHMGYSSENGRALKALSALIKYGFLENAEDGLRVSKRAISILYPESALDRKNALREASREPALFKEIFDRWPLRPSEESLKAFLIRREFNANSVEQVARAFYDTYDLVSGALDLDDADPDDSDDFLDEDDADHEAMPRAGAKRTYVTLATPPPHAQPFTGPDPAILNVTNPVFDFQTVTVSTRIDNREDLEKLINRLELIKSMLPPKPQP